MTTTGRPFLIVLTPFASGESKNSCENVSSPRNIPQIDSDTKLAAFCSTFKWSGTTIALRIGHGIFDCGSQRLGLLHTTLNHVGGYDLIACFCQIDRNSTEISLKTFAIMMHSVRWVAEQAIDLLPYYTRISCDCSTQYRTCLPNYLVISS